MKILHSIKGKLILFTLCISLIPISIITTVYYLNARSALKYQILQELTAIAESKKIHALSFMEEKRGRTIDFSSDGFIRDSLETIAQRGTQSYAVSNLNIHLNVNKKPIDPQIKEIAIIGLDGIVVSSTNQRIIGNDVSGHELFVNSINNKFGETYVGRTYRSQYLNENCIFISAPLTSKQNGKGETIGVIINAYAISSLNKITANYAGMGESGEVVIGQMKGNDIFFLNSLRHSPKTAQELTVGIEDPAAKPMELALSGNNGLIMAPDYRNIMVLAAYQFIPEFDWGLVAKMDKAEAFAPLRSLGIIATIVGGVCGGVTIIIGIVFSLSAIRPISKLKDATERFGKGDLDYRLNVSNRDEIGTLAGSFNSMAGEIKALTGSLEKRINERTWKLTRTNEKLLREITWRKQTEEELRKLSRAVEQSPVAVIITNVKGNIEYVNPKFTQSTGYTYEEAVGHTPRILKSGKQAAEVYKELWEKINSGEEWHGEFQNRKKTGELFWTTASVSPIKNSDGIITHYIGVQEDTTDRKLIEEELKYLNESLEKRVEERTDELAKVNENLLQEIDERNHAEEALQGSEEKSLLLLNSTGEAIYGLDLEGSCTFCNPSCLCLLGYEDESQLLGQNMHTLIHHTRKDGTPYPEEECCIYQAFREGKGSHVDDEVLWRADGTSFAAEYRSFPIFREGKAMGSVVSFVDITERIWMQEELVKMQKLESVGILAGGIAHDFNNGLQAIIGYISLAKMHINPDEEIYEYLNEAGKAVHQSKALTQQLLTFSKGGEPIKKIISVPELIRESVKLALSGSSIMCDLKIPDDLWVINADRGQLNQVISNLIINADQAMEEGGSIKVLAENTILEENYLLPLHSGRYIKITFEDHGTGISQKHLQKIFDPYFTTKTNGNGLGLATTYSIVKKHDGCITVESEIDVGTTFYIYLPASHNKDLKEYTPGKNGRSNNKHLKNKDATGPDISRGRVLIMDDEYTIRTMLSKYLKNLNYEVLTVADGNEAIHLYESLRNIGKPFNVVIMDLTIPGGMGGEETIKKLLEIDPGVKAIVSSGYANDPIVANHNKYGFTGVLAKPFEIHELDETIQKVIAMN